jgi:hypothetical protein
MHDMQVAYNGMIKLATHPLIGILEKTIYTFVSNRCINHGNLVWYGRWDSESSYMACVYRFAKLEGDSELIDVP